MKFAIILCLIGSTAMAQEISSGSRPWQSPGLPVSIAPDTKMSWQRMDSAPKDGKQIWAWCVGQSFGQKMEWQGVIFWNTILLMGSPEHWFGIPKDCEPIAWRTPPDPPDWR